MTDGQSLKSGTSPESHMEMMADKLLGWFGQAAPNACFDVEAI